MLVHASRFIWTMVGVVVVVVGRDDSIPTMPENFNFKSWNSFDVRVENIISETLAFYHSE